MAVSAFHKMTKGVRFALDLSGIIQYTGAHLE